MTTLPHCPKCSSELTYELVALLACPECGHECKIDGFGGMKLKSEFVRKA